MSVRSFTYKGERSLRYFSRGSTDVQLTFSLTGLDSTRQANLLLFVRIKATEPKPVKLETIHRVILAERSLTTMRFPLEKRFLILRSKKQGKVFSCKLYCPDYFIDLHLRMILSRRIM